MDHFSLGQLILFGFALIVVTKPMGSHMARVFEGKRTFLHRVLGPIERLTYRLARIDAEVEQTWKRYAVSVLSVSAFGFLLSYAFTRLQHWLPLNSGHLTPFSPDLEFATAAGALTNTI